MTASKSREQFISLCATGQGLWPVKEMAEKEGEVFSPDVFKAK